jgi:uncharacterized protein YjbI with pentapeptide repeats
MKNLSSNINNMPDDWNENNMQRDRLSGGSFQHLNLQNISLNGADMSGADFTATNFQNAQLRGVNLTKATLCGANLGGADLSGSDLSGANLRGADLTGANLSDIDWTGAYLQGAKFSRCRGIEQSVIEKLKKQGEIKPSPVEDRKWWLQFIVIPILVALISASVAIVTNTNGKSKDPVPHSPVEQQKQR